MWKLAIVIAHFFSTVTPTTVPSSYATKYILISWCVFLQIGSGGFLKKKNPALNFDNRIQSKIFILDLLGLSTQFEI